MSGFGDFPSFFSANPALSVSEGMSVDSLFQVSLEKLIWVQINDLAGPPKDIHRIVPKPLFEKQISDGFWRI